MTESRPVRERARWTRDEVWSAGYLMLAAGEDGKYGQYSDDPRVVLLASALGRSPAAVSRATTNIGSHLPGYGDEAVPLNVGEQVDAYVHAVVADPARTALEAREAFDRVVHSFLRRGEPSPDQ